VKKPHFKNRKRKFNQQIGESTNQFLVKKRKENNLKVLCFEATLLSGYFSQTAVFSSTVNLQKCLEFNNTCKKLFSGNK
jgi:hypothetical protein